VFPFWRAHALRSKSEEPFQKKQKTSPHSKENASVQCGVDSRYVLAIAPLQRFIGGNDSAVSCYVAHERIVDLVLAQWNRLRAAADAWSIRAVRF
jgi:hypothetical protein